VQGPSRSDGDAVREDCCFAGAFGVNSDLTIDSRCSSLAVEGPTYPHIAKRAAYWATRFTIGARGFEPPTSASRTQRSIQAELRSVVSGPAGPIRVLQCSNFATKCKPANQFPRGEQRPSARAVSRVLSPSITGRDHDGRRSFLSTRCRQRALPNGKQPTRESISVNDASSLLGLAPGGVYLATDLSAGAVRSYRTFSPLPCEALAKQGGLFSVALSLTWSSPTRPVGVTHHRRSMVLGLSSPVRRQERPSTHANQPLIIHQTEHLSPVITQVVDFPDPRGHNREPSLS
jgi:hypothetical protein